MIAKYDRSLPAARCHKTSGKITKWLKAEGDEINEYDPILELDTDSLYDEGQAPRSGPTAMIIEITEAGYVGKLFAEEGDLIEVGGIDLALISFLRRMQIRTYSY